MKKVVSGLNVSVEVSKMYFLISIPIYLPELWKESLANVIQKSNCSKGTTIDTHNWDVSLMRNDDSKVYNSVENSRM